MMSKRIENARRLDQEIQALQRDRNKAQIQIALLLLEMDKQDLARALGFASTAAYALQTLGYKASKTSSLLAIARAMPEFPLIRAAAFAGDLPWTKVRAVLDPVSREKEKEKYKMVSDVSEKREQ